MLHDAIVTLVGGGCALAGVGLGMIFGTRRRSYKPPKPVCGCRHHMSMHLEGGSGACSAQDQWNGGDCRCKHYVGPLPIETFYATPILPPGGNS
jgi:hypothetical protein